MHFFRKGLTKSTNPFNLHDYDTGKLSINMIFTMTVLILCFQENEKKLFF